MEIGTYKVYTEPNWEYELVTCILEKDGKREEESVKARKLLMSQKEIEKFLAHIKEYKENVLRKVLPLLEEYPDIKTYFINSTIEDDSRTRHILASLASHRELSKEHTADEIDRLMLEAFEKWEKFDDVAEQEVKLQNLTDIITFLKDLEEDDSTKFRLIMLYTERHTAIPRIQEFVKKGIKVLKEYYHIVQEDFDNAVITIKDKKNMEACMDNLEVLKLGNVHGMTVQPCIITYNQLSIDWNDEDNKDMIADTGIYMFLPDVMANDYSGNDAKIISALKALGDATRLKIIYLLSGKKMYVQELADELSLTPATVSHHMNILLQERLVSLTVDATKAKKIFYEINTSKIKELGEAVKLLGAMAEEKQE